MSVDSLGIHLGFLYIRFYALIIVTGIIAGVWVAVRRARAAGLNEEHIWNGLLWAIIPGVIGARLYHVFTVTPADAATGLSTQYYLQNPLQILAIWNGGLGIYGAIVGAGLGILVYCRRQKIPLLPWLDIIAPCAALGQAIGRWGNFVNHELYGAPTTLPWAITIPPENRIDPFKNFSTYHPLFLYESLWNLVAFGALLWIERRYRDRLRDGDIFLLYVMFYAIIRFFLDFVRLDSNGLGFITTAQIVSFLAFLAAGGALIFWHRKRRVFPPQTGASGASGSTTSTTQSAEPKAESIPASGNQ